MVYAVSDLHGMYELYEKICAKLKPEDEVIFLGDAGDRGPDGWKLIRAILDNPQWIYLLGNHEDMLINAIDETQAFDGRLDQGYDYLLSVHNGGQQTILDCLKDNGDLNEARELIKQHTRNYAKRQMTYIRHQFEVTFYKNDEELIKEIKNV